MNPKEDLCMRTLSQRARGAVMALGALLIIAIPFAVSPAAAKTEAQGTKTSQPKAHIATAVLSPRTVRTHVVAGRRAVVSGILRPRGAGDVVTVQRMGAHGWRTIARDRTSSHGVYRMTFRPRRLGSAQLRVRFGGDAQASAARKRIGRLNVYRRAFASWYGPGLYGQRLGCGGTPAPGAIGRAHQTGAGGPRPT